MGHQDVQLLNQVTTEFYRRFAESFDSTRVAPWPGWVSVKERVEARCVPREKVIRVLDVGCGNCRFERFLMTVLPEVSWEFTLVDNCPELAGEAAAALNAPATFRQADIIAGDDLATLAPAGGANLVTAFGLFHHIPSAALRRSVLQSLAACVAPGGLLAISCWQFMNDPHLAAKAEASTAAALPLFNARGLQPEALEPGDCILGWQDATPEEGAMRYCHHFSDADLMDLAAAAAAAGLTLETRFSADGRTGDLNTYLIFARPV